MPPPFPPPGDADEPPVGGPIPGPDERPDEHAIDRPPSGGRLWGVALLGAVVGALVAAIVTAVATDGDDGEALVARPAISTPDGAMDVQAILDQVQDSVVAIETSGFARGGAFGPGSGSGVILSPDGLILTNAHVVAGSNQIRVTLFDGSQHRAGLVGSSASDDLAVIRVDGVDDLSPATLGSSEALQVGEPVVAIGNALGLGTKPTVTSGIVSATNREIAAPDRGVRLNNLIQTDAAINPGNSGGPLVDAAGEVVGLNTAIIQDTQNIGFAIAMDPVRSVIEDLRQGEGDDLDTPLLGVTTVTLDEVDDAVKARFDVSADEGAFIVDVSRGTGADEAGLEPGDVIVAIDGEGIASSSDVGDVIRQHEVGDELEITIEREGRERTLTAELGSRTAG